MNSSSRDAFSGSHSAVTADMAHFRFSISDGSLGNMGSRRAHDPATSRTDKSRLTLAGREVRSEQRFGRCGNATPRQPVAVYHGGGGCHRAGGCGAPQYGERPCMPRKYRSGPADIDARRGHPPLSCLQASAWAGSVWTPPHSGRAE
jgi:hypothetical protein